MVVVVRGRPGPGPQSGVWWLVVEQKVADALASARSVCILNRGQIAFAGAPGELDHHEIVAN